MYPKRYMRDNARVWILFKPCCSLAVWMHKVTFLSNIMKNITTFKSIHTDHVEGQNKGNSNFSHCHHELSL